MSSYTTKKTEGDTAWFTHDRFGMFIHFGLYSMPARHEWVKSVEKISEEHYDKYFENFNPDDTLSISPVATFNPDLVRLNDDNWKARALF